MSAEKHRWSMTNIRPGYFVVEGCPKCRARSSFFSTEPIAPVDEYREGEHSWSYMGSYQAVKFDLECSDCGEVVGLDDMNALMLSTCVTYGYVEMLLGDFGTARAAFESAAALQPGSEKVRQRLEELLGLEAEAHTGHVR